MFDLPPDEGQQERCNRCPATVTASLDMLRGLGWVVFDGLSLSDAVLKVRICPGCKTPDDTAPVCVNWLAYRRCPTCQAVTGRPCTSHSRRIVEGRPDGVRTFLDRPHPARRKRSRAVKN